MTPFRSRTINRKRPVEVYRNLHTDGYSVRQDGYVVGHTDRIILRDVEFVVQRAGRERVLRTGVRNVHAWVRGYVMEPRATPIHVRVSYNPFVASYFWTDDGAPVERASRVTLVGRTMLMVP